MSDTPVPPQPSRRQRRAAPRRSPKGTTKVICRKGSLGLGPNLARALLDLSVGGVRLLVKEELRSGDEVEVTLSSPSTRRDIVRVAEIVWAVPVADGSYCVGVAFQKRLDHALLHDLSRFPSA